MIIGHTHTVVLRIIFQADLQGFTGALAYFPNWAGRGNNGTATPRLIGIDF